MLMRFLTGFVALACTSLASAHPGHDHSHWSSPAVHALFFVGVATVVAAGIWQVRKYRKTKQNDQGDS